MTEESSTAQQLSDVVKLFMAATLTLLSAGIAWMVRKTSGSVSNEKLREEIERLRRDLEDKIVPQDQVRVTVREIAVPRDVGLESMVEEACHDAHKAKNIAMVLLHEIITLRQKAGLPEKDFSSLFHERDGSR